MERRRLRLCTGQALLSKMETGNDSQLSSRGERSSSGSHNAQLPAWNLCLLLSIQKVPELLAPEGWKCALSILQWYSTKCSSCTLYPHLKKSIICENDHFYGSHIAQFSKTLGTRSFLVCFFLLYQNMNIDVMKKSVHNTFFLDKHTWLPSFYRKYKHV